MTPPDSPLEMLTQRLEDPTVAARWLRTLGIEDLPRGHANLVGIATSGMSLDLLSSICQQLEQLLPSMSDPDLALNTLERFVVSSRSPLSLGSLFERDPEALATLLQLFANSRFLGDTLVNDPEAFELVRMTEGKPVERGVLIDDICGEIAGMTERRAAMSLLRRHKRRETLRIAFGDLIRQQRLPVVTQQLSYLADALCEAALLFAYRSLSMTRGLPRRPDGRTARFAILALGKLGGVELNYSSDIDLVFLYDGDGKTDGEKQIANSEFFERLAQDFIKLLTESTDLGAVYRVDVRLRPHGQQGPLVISQDSALQYYDVMGRTWERQAYVKVRVVAGDLDLGQEFLAAIQPWIYRRYLNRADITGVKALKRKIEQRATREGRGDRDVKSGRGGIRDIEFVIQFLQLLNGGDLPELRTGNTLEAIARLTEAGCLNLQECTILTENYVFLRRLEHLLQIMLDVQTHSLPEHDDELAKLAIRMGYQDTSRTQRLQAFKDEYRLKTERNRRIFDHLLHDAFADDPETLPEVDLILDPDPAANQIAETLAPYRFQNLDAAYRNLIALSKERIPFLSTRRCRHFLASIAPALLRAVGQTPDPDAALVNLCHVSDSLGGKGILWELFSFNPPSLQLYVRLCATSPYLSTILTGNPGMLDELMDSLVLNKLPDFRILSETLKDRLRGAEDPTPILHSFKNAQHLSAGVRDVLGKESIRRTTQFLSDVAEVCVQELCDQQLQAMVKRYGHPWNLDEDRPCELILLAMGKFGGSEPNYHSDLDVVFLYETEGSTRPKTEGRSSTQITSNQHFFSELAQRIIKACNTMGPFGRLYELDAKLRPSGSSGSLAVSLEAFANYFAGTHVQLWERQALCRARPVYGSCAAQAAAGSLVQRILAGTPWQREFAVELARGRRMLEQNAAPRNLKRSPGGIVDVEFVVQMLQLKHAATTPEILKTGTLEGLDALKMLGLITAADATALSDSYTFLRSVEARLRLMNTTARHDLPADPRDLVKLAYLLDTTPDALAERCRATMALNREIYQRLLDAELPPTELAEVAD